MSSGEGDLEIAESQSEASIAESHDLFDVKDEVMSDVSSVLSDHDQSTPAPNQAINNKKNRARDESDNEVHPKKKKKVQIDPDEPELRSGRWLKSEERVLVSNAKQFMEEWGLDEYSEVFKLPNKDQKCFFSACGVGINREHELIWRKCIRTFNPLNRLGKYTANEEQQLMVLYDKYKDEQDFWVLIGAEMGRSNASVRDKVKLYNAGYKEKVRRTWTKEETRLLREGMKRYKVSDDSGCKTQWSFVAKHVGTKNARDCMYRWSQVNNTESLHALTLNQEITLVEMVNKAQANHSSDIDWYLISQQWPTTIDLRVLKRSFRKIVTRYVSTHMKADISHNELMAILMENFVARVKREADRIVKIGSQLSENIGEAGS